MKLPVPLYCSGGAEDECTGGSIEISFGNYCSGGDFFPVFERTIYLSETKKQPFAKQKISSTGK